MCVSVPLVKGRVGKLARFETSPQGSIWTHPLPLGLLQKPCPLPHTLMSGGRTSAHRFQLSSTALPHVLFSVMKTLIIIIMNVKNKQTWQQKDSNHGITFQANSLSRHHGWKASPVPTQVLLLVLSIFLCAVFSNLVFILWFCWAVAAAVSTAGNVAAFSLSFLSGMTGSLTRSCLPRGCIRHQSHTMHGQSTWKQGREVGIRFHSGRLN